MYNKNVLDFLNVDYLDTKIIHIKYKYSECVQDSLIAVYL